MKFSLLLYYLHIVSLLRLSAAASSTICEAVSREAPAEPSCHPVGDCIDVATPSESSEPGVRCLESESCPSNRLSDGAAINYNATDKHYSIEGLPRFNGSRIGYCPSPPNPYQWYSAACDPRDDLSLITTNVGDLTIDYNPIDAKFYEATLSWTYPNEIPEDISAYKLFVYGPGIKYPGYCLCIQRGFDVTNYSLTLEYDDSEQFDATIQVVTFPLSNHLNRNTNYPPLAEIKHKRFPAHCSDYQRGLAYSSTSCGTHPYGKPRNVQVQRSGVSTTLSWDKPCFQDSNACKFVGIDDSGPDTYFLTTTVDNVTSHFVIYSTTEVTLSTADQVDFKLFTHTPCSGLCEMPFFPNGCSQPAMSPGEASNDTCCMPPTSSPPSIQVTMATTPTPTDTSPTPPSTSSPTNHRHVIIPVVVVVVLALVIVTIILIPFFCYRQCPNHSEKQGLIRLLPPSSAPCPVLVVFSPRTSELESRTILQCLVGDLNQSPYCIESCTYGIGKLRQSPSEWMEERRKEARAILCVCNREFFEDWTGSYADFDNTPQVVRTLKQLFEGDMQRTPSGTDNYAVIKMRSTDDQFIPPLLKSREAFMYNQVDEISRFSCNQPKYVL